MMGALAHRSNPTELTFDEENVLIEQAQRLLSDHISIDEVSKTVGLEFQTVEAIARGDLVAFPYLIGDRKEFLRDLAALSTWLRYFCQIKGDWKKRDLRGLGRAFADYGLHSLVDSIRQLADRLDVEATPWPAQIHASGVLNYIDRILLANRSPTEEVAEGSTPPAHAVYLGKGLVRIGKETLVISPLEDESLCALLELGGAADSRALIKQSGSDRSPRVLRRLRGKYDGKFKNLVSAPGARGKGGYRTSIEDARSKGR